jgi:hypothetical protein
LANSLNDDSFVHAAHAEDCTIIELESRISSSSGMSQVRWTATFIFDRLLGSEGSAVWAETVAMYTPLALAREVSFDRKIVGVQSDWLVWQSRAASRASASAEA